MALGGEFSERAKRTNVCRCRAVKACNAGAVEKRRRQDALDNWGKRLLHLICNFGHMLRISFYGPSDLLSSLYAASRAQVTFGPK